MFTELTNCSLTPMKHYFQNTVHKTTLLEETHAALLQALENIRTEFQINKIGFVSGSITSDGPEHIQKNIEKLKNHTENLRGQFSFPIICCPDIFIDEMNMFHEKNNTPYNDFVIFWRNVLSSGYITDLFMTPGWEKSTGARDEHETAKKNNIIIHYLSS
jgi:hypothetical protein